MPTRTGTDDDAQEPGALELRATTISTEDLRVARFIDRQTPGNVGVALSGGGSRAATAAMGQLRALHELGLLDRVREISAVSGGGWLSAAWTFLPQDRSDAEFFGPCVADPGALTPVLANRWFGTHPRTIDVLWFYLNPASQWTDRLSRTAAKLLPHRWPNYPSADTGLGAPAVNYLAHFASWVVAQQARDLRALFGEG